MSLRDVEKIRKLISVATNSRSDLGVERDRMGPIGVTTLSRPRFEELESIAAQSPSILIGMYPSIRSVHEKLAVCEALSGVTDAVVVPFWESLVESESNEEILSCAAIGLARQGQSVLLEKLEQRSGSATSDRMLFHLGIARLLVRDSRGVDYLIDLLRRDAARDRLTASKSPAHGMTMKYVTLGLLMRIFPEGPSEDIAQWISWWDQRRVRHRSIDCSALQPYELAYMPPLSAFLGAKGDI